MGGRWGVREERRDRKLGWVCKMRKECSKKDKKLNKIKHVVLGLVWR